MKVRLFLWLLCASAIVVLFAGSDGTRSQTNQLVSDGDLSTAEGDLLSAVNSARAHPGVYASYLEKLKPLFNGKVYTPSGQEAYSAADNGIVFLLSDVGYKHRAPNGAHSPHEALAIFP